MPKKLDKMDFEISEFQSRKINATKEELNKLQSYFKSYVKVEELGITHESIDELNKKINKNYFIKSEIDLRLEDTKKGKFQIFID